MGDERASPLALGGCVLQILKLLRRLQPLANYLICPSDQTTMAAAAWLLDRWSASVQSALRRLVSNSLIDTLIIFCHH